MTQFIFEDADNSKISILFKNCYLGNNFHFSGGNNKIAQKIKEVYRSNKDDDIIVYFDVSPNNPITINKFNNLCTSCIDRYRGKVKVIPIPCIEYIVLDMLDFYDLLLYDNSLYISLWSHIHSFSLNKEDFMSLLVSLSLSTSTLETVLKSILNNHSLSCLHNRASLGDFYSKDCTCISTCNNFCSLSLSKKAEYLYSRLPYHILDGLNHKSFYNSMGITGLSTTFREVLLRLKDYYIRAFSAYEKDFYSMAFDICICLGDM